MQFTHHQLVSIWLSVIELKQHIHQHTNHLANNVRWQTLQVKKKNIIIKKKNNNKLEEKRRKKYIYKVKNPAYRRHWIFQCLRIVTPIPNNPKKNRKKKLSSVMCHVSCVTSHLTPVPWPPWYHSMQLHLLQHYFFQPEVYKTCSCSKKNIAISQKAAEVQLSSLLRKLIKKTWHN